MAVTAALCAAISMLNIDLRLAVKRRDPMTWKIVLAGFRYVGQKKVVLGSISLDLFAVLLGGAVALLPVYARDILKTGPWGLGLLRCAPAIGAATTALVLAHRPLGRGAGVKMLWCVAAFGAATILFGVSRNIVLSMIALALVGASDMVSVVVRGILVQLATPDEMRGRVNALDMIFIGTSNELGGFESGVTAQWLGAVPAVILGGIGAIIVTALWAWYFPELRNTDEIMARATRNDYRGLRAFMNQPALLHPVCAFVFHVLGRVHSHLPPAKLLNDVQSEIDPRRQPARGVNHVVALHKRWPLTRVTPRRKVASWKFSNAS